MHKKKIFIDAESGNKLEVFEGIDKYDACNLIQEIIDEIQTFDSDDNIIPDEIEKIKKLETVLNYIEGIEED